MTEQHQGGNIGKEGNRGGTALLELIDRTLDKGVVLEGYVRVPALGVELLTIDIRALVASIEKYLEYAEAIEQTAGIVEGEAVEGELSPPEQTESGT